jgi:tetratricopeptide (TPR) repeat protein
MVGSSEDAKQAHRRALAIREHLAADHPANDDYQRALAASLVTQYVAGAWERALAIRERLAMAHPDILRDQIDLAESLTLSITLEGSLADNKRIVDELRRHGVRLEELVAAYPDVPEIRRRLAELYLRIGAYLGIEGDYEGKLRYSQRCRDVLEGMTTAPTDADRSLLAVSYSAIGQLLRAFNRPVDALPAMRKAVEHQEQYLAHTPTARSRRNVLAVYLCYLGDLQREVGFLAEAGDSLRRSRSILEELATTDSVYKSNLDRTYTALGRLEGALGRPAEAAEMIRLAITGFEERLVVDTKDMPDPVISHAVGLFYDACDALIEVRGPIEPLLHARARFERLDREGRLKPMARQVLLLLDIRIARAFRQAGRLAEAREAMRRVESELEIFRGAGHPSWYPYNLACVYAQLSNLVGRPGTAPSPAERAEIRAYRDRAMAELRRALAAGIPWTSILGDRDLDSLRDRPDFQALVSDLAFPADPFAP